MNALRLHVTLEDGPLLAAVDRAIAALSDSAGLMESIGDKLEKNARLRFETKTDPEGKAWAKLETESELAQYWNARKYPSGEIPGTLLERTRQLVNSLAHNAGEGWLEVGTTRTVPGKSQATWEVGLLHEFGTSRMPRRGILTADPKTGRLGDQDEADVLAVIANALGSAFSG